MLASAERCDPRAAAWTAAGSLKRARGGHTATLLSDGRILIVGGAADHIIDVRDFYDPAADTWTGGIYLNDSRGRHTATLLPNGNVLVIGGKEDTQALGGYRLLSGIVYRVPASNAWIVAGPLAEIVAQSDLLAVVPWQIAVREEKAGRVTCVPAGNALPAREISVFSRSDVPPTPIAREFMDVLRDAARRVGPLARAAVTRLPGQRARA